MIKRSNSNKLAFAQSVWQRRDNWEKKNNYMRSLTKIWQKVGNESVRCGRRLSHIERDLVSDYHEDILEISFGVLWILVIEISQTLIRLRYMFQYILRYILFHMLLFINLYLSRDPPVLVHLFLRPDGFQSRISFVRDPNIFVVWFWDRPLLFGESPVFRVLCHLLLVLF